MGGAGGDPLGDPLNVAASKVPNPILVLGFDTSSGRRESSFSEQIGRCG